MASWVTHLFPNSLKSTWNMRSFYVNQQSGFNIKKIIISLLLWVFENLRYWYSWIFPVKNILSYLKIRIETELCAWLQAPPPGQLRLPSVSCLRTSDEHLWWHTSQRATEHQVGMTFLCPSWLLPVQQIGDFSVPATGQVLNVPLVTQRWIRLNPYVQEILVK